MTTTSLDYLTTSLQVPPEYSRSEHISDEETLSRLETWKTNAHHHLSELRTLLNQNASELSLQEQARVISTIAVFDGDGPWISLASQELCRDIMGYYPKPSIPLFRQILTHHVKPIFQSNPHPQLNLSTGRKLPHPAGGPMASQDYYEGQTWKNHPGASNLLSWCVRSIDTDFYEELWHLIIPPVMTFLDDYEVHHKLRGIEIVSEMLDRVPKNLLKRTGVDGLLFSSLKTSLTYLQNPETPSLLRAAIPTTVSLIQLTTLPGSTERFDQLCVLLGDGIIGGIWFYASQNLDAIQASVDALPQVITALGIGSARFLKGLVPQLVHPLLPNPLNPPPLKLQISSVQALVTLIDNCSPRIYRWKGTILEGIAKSWVTLVDSGEDDNPNVDLLKHELQNACYSLAKSCPSVTEDEYKRLLVADADIFKTLLPHGI